MNINSTYTEIYRAVKPQRINKPSTTGTSISGSFSSAVKDPYIQKIALGILIGGISTFFIAKTLYSYIQQRGQQRNPPPLPPRPKTEKSKTQASIAIEPPQSKKSKERVIPIKVSTVSTVDPTTKEIFHIVKGAINGSERARDHLERNMQLEVINSESLKGTEWEDPESLSPPPLPSRSTSMESKRPSKTQKKAPKFKTKRGPLPIPPGQKPLEKNQVPTTSNTISHSKLNTLLQAKLNQRRRLCGGDKSEDS